ncbi:hypothetical protein OG572_41180 [Streptomyces virginiae]|uniref:hypothetical protein n=1 Tax=Streptomyces virginiae TaxID=1961 RepID=UPI00324E9727
MQITVRVSDVNGTPLPDARIQVVFTAPGPLPTSLSLRPGEVRDVTLAKDELEFHVSRDGFTEDRFTFAATASGWLSSNPAGQAFQLGTLLDVSTTIGTVRLAPTIGVPPGSPLVNNPQAALVDDVGEPDWIYRDARHNPETMQRLDEPVFGNLTGPPQEPEWNRFKHSQIAVDLASRGRFVLLEYGPRPTAGSRRPRFLIGTWVPYKPLPASPEVVVFFSPPTFPERGFPVDSYPFLGNYPYGLDKLAKQAKDAHQPYVGHLVNYLITGYKIVYQLLAANRNPIVIMPTPPSANWGPFDTQPGLARLIKEVVRFLYATQLTSSRTAPLVKLRLLNGRTELFPWNGRRTNEPLPRAFAASVSGFSAGINPVVKLCTADRLDDKLYPADLYQSPPGELLNNWREIWDVDGVDVQGWNHMTSAFNGWLAGTNASRRGLRSYHSQDTYSAAQNGLVPTSRVTRLPPVPVRGIYVEEGNSDDGRVTWVHFSNPSLIGDTKAPGHVKTIPEFGSFDAHHMVPAIAFGHAAQFPLR